ncbi:MAG: glycosyltransferase family 4 protein [Thermoplasmatales archaeon]
MKINFILYSTERTGGTKTILNYANELSRRGNEVSLTTLYHDPWFKLNSEVNVISKRTKISLSLFYASTLLLSRLGKTSLSAEVSLLEKLAVMSPISDINVATFFPTAYVSSWLAHKATPFYFIWHDPDYFATEPIQKKFYNDTLFLPVNKIVNSTWLQKRVYDKTKEKCFLMNTGAVDSEIFKPSPSRGERENEIHIVALGKGGFKNSKLIMDAVKEVRLKNPTINIFLHFFGHRLPKDLRMDTFTIFHKDLSDDKLAELFSMADIQITASTAESFPLPPLEAMASGCTVITTPYGTEDYAIDGSNCLIVRPDDVQDLVRQLEKLIFDPVLRKKLSDEGLKTVRRFSYRDQAVILENLFRSESIHVASNVNRS